MAPPTRSASLRRRLYQLLLLVLALPGLSASALEPSVQPGIHALFENPAMTQWTEAFEREGSNPPMACWPRPIGRSDRAAVW